MSKGAGTFITKLSCFTLILWGIHCALAFQFFPDGLYYPLWAIYLFNFVLVLLVYCLLHYNQKRRPQDQLKLFLLFTGFKMIAAVLFLLPLFSDKTAHVQLETFNFFIPYFLFLILEIKALNRVLQKS